MPRRSLGLFVERLFTASDRPRVGCGGLGFFREARSADYCTQKIERTGDKNSLAFPDSRPDRSLMAPINCGSELASTSRVSASTDADSCYANANVWRIAGVRVYFVEVVRVPR